MFLHGNSYNTRLDIRIDTLKNELYRKLDTRNNLTSPEVYILSLKLDELINEYHHQNWQKV